MSSPGSAVPFWSLSQHSETGRAKTTPKSKKRDFVSIKAKRGGIR
jgi:hypothetical protein